MIQKFRHIIARVKVLRLLQGMLSRRDVGASIGLAFCQLAWKQLSRGVDTATCSCAKLKPVWICLDDAVLCIGAFVFTPTSQHQCSHAVSKRPVGDQLERGSSRDRDSSTALQWRNISASAIGAPAVLKHGTDSSIAMSAGFVLRWLVRGVA